MQNYWSFKGLATALITPFKDGNIDYPALAEIIERQISAGIETLVALGTTGESCTLTEAPASFRTLLAAFPVLPSPTTRILFPANVCLYLLPLII